MSIAVDNSNVAEVIEDLRTFLDTDMVTQRDIKFANDLVHGKYGFDARGYLSDKQMYHVGRIVGECLGVENEPDTETVGNLDGFVSLFVLAKQNLKYPKINLDTDLGPLRFTIAGPKAKFPGTINITDGGPYGANKWYGRVTTEGEWTPSNQVSDKLRNLISRTLTKFSKNPKSAAMSYGHMSSQCCFCAKKLDTKESVTAGYGPVCASNWGLPWGDV